MRVFQDGSNLSVGGGENIRAVMSFFPVAELLLVTCNARTITKLQMQWSPMNWQVWMVVETWDIAFSKIQNTKYRIQNTEYRIHMTNSPGTPAQWTGLPWLLEERNNPHCPQLLPLSSGGQRSIPFVGFVAMGCYISQLLAALLWARIIMNFKGAKTSWKFLVY